MIRGDLIQARRKALNMTQMELAQAVGISQGFLSQIEAGQRDVSTNTLVDLARTLKIPVAALLGLPQSEFQDSEPLTAVAS